MSVGKALERTPSRSYRLEGAARQGGHSLERGDDTAAFDVPSKVTNLAPSHIDQTQHAIQ